MHQSNSLPDVRLICLVPPNRVQTMPASTKQKRLEEFKIFLDDICQLTTCQLDEQELELFLEWSELPWYAVQLPHMKRYEEYVVDAVEQYKQFIRNNSQTERIVFKVPSHLIETDLLPIPLNRENSSQTLGELQSSSIEEDLVALTEELVVQFQAVMPPLERWRKYLEDNALIGELHSYPKRGKLRWNYYPHTVDAEPEGKDKRRYVRQNDVDAYRRAIVLGKQLKQVQALHQQLATFIDEIRSSL